MIDDRTLEHSLHDAFDPVEPHDSGWEAVLRRRNQLDRRAAAVQRGAALGVIAIVIAASVAVGIGGSGERVGTRFAPAAGLQLSDRREGGSPPDAAGDRVDGRPATMLTAFEADGRHHRIYAVDVDEAAACLELFTSTSGDFGGALERKKLGCPDRPIGHPSFTLDTIGFGDLTIVFGSAPLTAYKVDIELRASSREVVARPATFGTRVVYAATIDATDEIERVRPFVENFERRGIDLPIQGDRDPLRADGIIGEMRDDKGPVAFAVEESAGRLCIRAKRLNGDDTAISGVCDTGDAGGSSTTGSMSSPTFPMTRWFLAFVPSSAEHAVVLDRNDFIVERTSVQKIPGRDRGAVAVASRGDGPRRLVVLDATGHAVHSVSP